MALFDQERNACEMVRMRELDCKGRARCEGGDLRGGQGAREDADLVDVPHEIRCNMTNQGSRRRPYRRNRTCRVGRYELPDGEEVHLAGSQHSGGKMRD